MTSTLTTGPLVFLDTAAQIRVSGDESDGRLAIVEMIGHRGHMPPPHVHRLEDEVFVVLDGEISVFRADETIRLTSGETAFAPKDVPHTFRVESETARWLAVAAPAGFDRFVTTLGRPTDRFELPTEPEMPEPEELARISGVFGIELLGPPGALPS